MSAVGELAKEVGVSLACRAFSLPRSTYYRWSKPSTGRQQRRPTPARALSARERDQVYEVLCSERFVDASPAETTATLLDEGVFLCSTRTMYRVLAERRSVRERRRQRVHPQHRKPRLVARRPNHVWSWDITRLLGPAKWRYCHLYVILDLFSRYVVGWMVADRETAALGCRLIEETCAKQGVRPHVVTLHSDRGSPMTSQGTAQLLANLGVTRSLGRPRVSNDNPFSEAQFKTLKYHPSFPGRFADVGDAQAYCRSFFDWYNHRHRHAGIAMLSPAQVHSGQADAVVARRQLVLVAACARHPERFVSRPPKAPSVPSEVWINPPPAISVVPDESR